MAHNTLYVRALGRAAKLLRGVEAVGAERDPRPELQQARPFIAAQ